ncbi:hypothetical protein N7462_000137 [Penicillium macrosclerotiorum]|uniref:uncharacterized protein n=1 Tax=Penicillium macrosclerotiorum TaxID=303699 RepID=UPI0025469BF2|nr:uncharacterized protein N7462_000137 [Penicillium macrosclerotiorum]KAJ5698132.1 hypothetical protein N7462_000137 [Penicillium macrosclerotiorum]
MNSLSEISCYHETLKGARLHFTKSGNRSGDLIILLHGLGGSTETFRTILPALLPEKNCLVSVDLEGFGKSLLSSADPILSIPRYVDDLEHLVASLQGTSEELSKGQILFIGHSLGAIISLHYAARYPDKIRGLALLGAGRSFSHIPAARERMLRLAATTREKGIEAAAEIAVTSNFPSDVVVALKMRQIVRDAVLSCDAESYARACEAIAGLDHLDPDYGSICAPTLLLSGGNDVISPPERSVGLQEVIGDNAWVEVLGGVGHQIIIQEPALTTKAINVLLEKIDK